MRIYAVEDLSWTQLNYLVKPIPYHRFYKGRFKNQGDFFAQKEKTIQQQYFSFQWRAQGLPKNYFLFEIRTWKY